MQRGASGIASGEAASTTPPASAARNFDGIVSRCLESSVCSKVPRKAINRVLGGRPEAKNPDGWVGGALPSGFHNACHASATLSHSPPHCNPFLINCPTRPHPGPSQGRIARGQKG